MKGYLFDVKDKEHLEKLSTICDIGKGTMNCGKTALKQGVPTFLVIIPENKK